MELRGRWKNRPELVAGIIEEFDLMHVVDPFRCECVSETELAYYRLHGIGGEDVNYSYKYTSRDLEDLRSYVLKTKAKKSFVFFNNISMSQDASRFKKVIEGNTGYITEE